MDILRIHRLALDRGKRPRTRRRGGHARRLGSAERWQLAVRCMFLLGFGLFGWLSSATAQLGFVAPSSSYYSVVEDLYQGEYRDAQREFLQELRGAVKSVTARWIDSLCYHAMLGETYYHMGRLGDALDQFNFAADIYLQYPKWMLRVNFSQPPRVDATLARTVIPWGASDRRAALGNVARNLTISQGTLDNSAAVRQGGVVQQAQLWSVDVVEVNRCLALTLRRRNELLGPIGKHDALSQRLLRELMRGGAPPNHWSGAWVEINRGLAHAGVGETDQALEHLEQGLLLGGEFDHPLTCVALLEQGRLHMERDAAEVADRLLMEASRSAYLYQDVGVIDEAFRWASVNRLAHGDGEVNPALAHAAAWARRKGFDHVASRLQLALADELMAARQWPEAGAAFAAGQSRMSDAAKGVLGNWALFLAARLDLQQGRDGGAARLATALEGRAQVSPHNLQIALANAMVDEQTLRSRAALEVYGELLADPRPQDMRFRLFDALAVMKTPQQGAFDRWLQLELERKDPVGVFAAIDANKRRRYHQALPWGGRLESVRRLLASPASLLSAEERVMQNDLLMSWPALDKALVDETDARNVLGQHWEPASNAEALGKQQKTWRLYADAVERREGELTLVALERIVAPYAFPPRRTLPEIQARLLPGEAVVVFHDTPGGMLGLLASASDATFWDCGPSARLAGLVSQLLRDLGNHDGNRQITFEALQDTAWQKPAEQLYLQLFGESSIDPEALEELIVVPDGVLWYLPFETLIVKSETQIGSLTGFTRIHYAPTASLGLRFDEPWRRVQRSGVVLGPASSGEDESKQRAKTEPLVDVLENGLIIPPGPPAGASLATSLLDQAIFLGESELVASDPWSWEPCAFPASAGASLADWLVLSGRAPQRVVAPVARTAAERGGKRASRRGAGASLPGNELFLASCALMSSGVETLLISRWRVGGQSTLDAVREFTQELPHGSASAAWQRSIQLAATSPIDAANEMRVKASTDATELTAAHPFFWAGYLLVDSGWKGPEPIAPPEGVAAADEQKGAEPKVEDAKPAEPAPPPDKGAVGIQEDSNDADSNDADSDGAGRVGAGAPNAAKEEDKAVKKQGVKKSESDAKLESKRAPETISNASNGRR